jgi:hypothetical protein
LEKLNDLRKDWDDEHNEIYKLELWVRHDPASSRHLSLWASSTGVLEDRRCLKSEDLDLNSTNASVRAFMEGRPLWLARSDLNKVTLRAKKRRWIEMLEGRWNRYLAVPIRLDFNPNMRIPVGAITLAALGASDRTQGNVKNTNLPIDDARRMSFLVQALHVVGTSILEVATEVTS